MQATGYRGKGVPGKGVQVRGYRQGGTGKGVQVRGSCLYYKHIMQGAAAMQVIQGLRGHVADRAVPSLCLMAIANACKCDGCKAARCFSSAVNTFTYVNALKIMRQMACYEGEVDARWALVVMYRSLLQDP